MDLNMPGGAALETLARLHRRHPGLASLVFSMYANASFARQAFAAGARGYVTKSSAPETLLRAVREIRAGRRYLSADIAQLLAWERFGDERGALDGLSVREFEVLRLLLDGRNVDSIAAALNLSPKSVRNLHYAVKRKLGVRDDIELVRLAVRLYVIDLLELGDERGVSQTRGAPID
jgi:DNA-binding NarL/FixJ family response regulator